MTKSLQNMYFVLVYIILITIDPILGDSRPSCLIDFTYDDLLNCCTTNNGISLTREIHYSRAFFAYNVQNISVQQKWLSPPHHYHNDLGLVISNFHSSQYQVRLELCNNQCLLYEPISDNA